MSVRCPICGTEHIECGGPSGSVPIDQRVSAPMPSSRMVQVQIRRGYTIQMAEDIARTYVNGHPTAQIVNDTPEKPSEPEPENEPEPDDAEVKHVDEPPADKQVRRKRTKRRKSE